MSSRAEQAAGAVGQPATPAAAFPGAAISDDHFIEGTTCSTWRHCPA
jgi:hypothetical protein